MEIDKEDTDFYVHLHSTSSRAHFEDNKPGNFANFLGRSYELDDPKWRVGLATITFDQAWDNLSVENSSVTVFNVKKKEQKSVKIPDGFYPSPQEICEAINVELDKIRYRIRFKYAKSMKKVTATCRSSFGFLISNTSKLADYLGFPANKIFAQNEDKVKKINKMLGELQINRYREEKKVEDPSTPEEDASPEDVEKSTLTLPSVYDSTVGVQIVNTKNFDDPDYVWTFDPMPYSWPTVDNQPLVKGSWIKIKTPQMDKARPLAKHSYSVFETIDSAGETVSIKSSKPMHYKIEPEFQFDEDPYPFRDVSLDYNKLTFGGYIAVKDKLHEGMYITLVKSRSSIFMTYDGVNIVTWRGIDSVLLEFTAARELEWAGVDEAISIVDNSSDEYDEEVFTETFDEWRSAAEEVTFDTSPTQDTYGGDLTSIRPDFQEGKGRRKKRRKRQAEKEYTIYSEMYAIVSAINKIFLYCDIARGRQMGNFQGKILQMIPVYLNKDELSYKEFNPIQYSRLSETFFDRIRIKMTDSFGSEIRFTGHSEVVAILHFKKV